MGPAHLHRVPKFGRLLVHVGQKTLLAPSLKVVLSTAYSCLTPRVG
jgi:hypothetical protein